MKKRKFDGGGEIDDAEEAKYKALGLAASNAEKKSSGFFGRFGEGNIDEKGSEAYNKYGAGYGRRLEAEKAANAPKVNTAPQAQAVAPVVNTTPQSQAVSPVVKTAPAARPAMPSDEDTSFNSLESKRLASPRVSPGVTRVTEDMPTKRPEVGGQVTTGDARVAEYANAFPSNRDEGLRAAKRGSGATTGSGTAAAKTPAAAKAASRTQNNDQAEDQTNYDSLEKKRLASQTTGGSSRGGQGGPTAKQFNENEEVKAQKKLDYESRRGPTYSQLKAKEEADTKKRLGSGGGRGPTAAQFKEYQDAKTRTAKKSSSMPFAQGGSVKGWGQARGARSAKIC